MLIDTMKLGLCSVSAKCLANLNENIYTRGMSQGKGMESANKYARKWPILPFDVSRDFIPYLTVESLTVLHDNLTMSVG